MLSNITKSDNYCVVLYYTVYTINFMFLKIDYRLLSFNLQYLQKIGSTFFGAKMPETQSKSNGLLQMLMGEGGGEGLNNLMSSMSNMLGLSEGLPPEFQGLESVEGLD